VLQSSESRLLIVCGNVSLFLLMAASFCHFLANLTSFLALIILRLIKLRKEMFRSCNIEILILLWVEGNGSGLIIYTQGHRQFHYRHFQPTSIHAKQNHVRGWFCGVFWEVDMFAYVGTWKDADMHVFSQAVLQ